MKVEGTVAIVGGGPAGLRAAEVAASGGARVVVFDRMASAGRKFLVAGGGGLNLTHSEPLDRFAARYGDAARWRPLLEAFSSEALREWAKELGVETFVGTSGRVFPAEKKAAPLLRRWVTRLRAQGVVFQTRHTWTGWRRESDGLCLQFEHEGQPVEFPCDAAVLALGGASWPQTGSDGAWTGPVTAAGFIVTPWQPANCGYHVAWPPEVLARAEGLPLKNIAVTAGGVRVEGDCVVTRYGIEGGPVYHLGPRLRADPRLEIDFKPALSADALRRKWGTLPRSGFLASATPRWRLGPAAVALLETAGPYADPEALIAKVKSYRLEVGPPRPLAEAISSAGGLAWAELDGKLMLRRAPGLFAAGEMIDWEAPTGGYLLQGAFATGTAAGKGVLAFLRGTGSGDGESA